MLKYRGKLSTRRLCEVFRVSTSGFYGRLSGRSSSREGRDLELLKHIRQAHHSSRKTYGSRRVYRVLKRDDVKVGKARVERLMRENGIRSVHKRKFRASRDSLSQGLVSENLLNQCFEVTEPNKTWVGDISVPQQSCMRDEGRSLAISLQEPVANHHMRLGSKAPVVSDVEKVSSRHQV